MSHLLILLKAASRSQLRWALQHLYSLLILGPIVFGLTYATVSRMAENLPPVSLSGPTLGLASGLMVACVIAMTLSRASTELYHARRPESYFDALPVASHTLLHVALIDRATRTAILAAVIFLLHSQLFKTDTPKVASLAPLALFVLVVAMSETLAALNWIHWSHKREKRIAAIALAATLLAALLGGELLLLALRPDKLPFTNRTALLVAGAGAVALLYWAVNSLHERWRYSDMEYARRLQASKELNIFGKRLFEKRLGPIVSVQLARDLQLTIRAFSSAVYVSAAIALLLCAALLAALTTGWLPPAFEPEGWFDTTWLPAVMAIKLATAAITLSLAGLVPVLVAYELPHFWLERAADVTGLDMWQAKFWYARIVSLAAPLLAWLVGTATGEVPASYALPLLLECLWCWWAVSSIVGSLSFEIPERTVLSIITMVTVGGAAGVFSAMLWPFGVILYFQSMHSLTERGRERARYYLLMGAD